MTAHPILGQVAPIESLGRAVLEAINAPCRICRKPDCDDDCEELALIYREQQREKLRDIDVDEIHCDYCGLTYGEASHDDCSLIDDTATGATP